MYIECPQDRAITPEFQKKCIGKIGEIANNGRTVLFVSHDMARIKKICDFGLLLDNGQVKFIGDISKAIELYSSSNIENKDSQYTKKLPEKNLDAEIKRVYFLNMKNEKINNIKIGQNWKCIVSIKVRKNISSFISSISISNSEDIHIRTVFDEPKKLTPGNYYIEFLNDDFVYSYSCNSLFLTIGISNFEKPIEYLEKIVRLDLINVPDNKLHKSVIRSNNRAVLLNPMPINIRKK